MKRTISSSGDVQGLGELLNGASVDRSRFALDGGALCLELELTRACLELKTSVRRGFVTRTRVPWMKSRLTLEQVTAVVVLRVSDALPQEQPVLLCEPAAVGYRVIVTNHDGLQLHLTMTQLAGIFEDIGKPIDPP